MSNRPNQSKEVSVNESAGKVLRKTWEVHEQEEGWHATMGNWHGTFESASDVLSFIKLQDMEATKDGEEVLACISTINWHPISRTGKAVVKVLTGQVTK